MIRHTVSFSLIHPAGSDAEAVFLRDGEATLTTIPGVMNFTVSRQVSPKSTDTFHFGMDFEDEAAFKAYDGHPTHVAFVNDRWIPEVAHFQEIDLIHYRPTSA